MPVAPGALSVTLSQCCRRLVAASFIGIKCHSVVPTAGANSHTEESGLCVLFQFAQSRVLGGNTRKAGSPISKTLRYLCISAKASAFIGYKFPNFSIHEHPNRCLLLYVAFLIDSAAPPPCSVAQERFGFGSGALQVSALSAQVSALSHCPLPSARKSPSAGLPRPPVPEEMSPPAYSAKPFLNFCAALPSKLHSELSACSTVVNNLLFFSLACCSFYSSSHPYQGGFPRRDFRVLNCPLFTDFLSL